MSCLDCTPMNGCGRWCDCRCHATAAAWDEGFEAGATWSPSGPSGISSDPPSNPYDDDAALRVRCLSVRAGDVLPDGRIDHRHHRRENMGGFGEMVCVDCTSEDGPPVQWTIPHDLRGLPIPEGWRDQPYELIRHLCGMDSSWQVPVTPPLAEPDGAA